MVSLKSKPDSISIDVGTQSKNGRSFAINPLTLSTQLQTELKPYRSVPDIIESGLLTKNRKKIPVKVISDIQYRQRFSATSPLVVIPDSITISGPPEIIAPFNEIRTLPLQLKDVHQEFFSSIRLEKSLPRGVTFSDQYVYCYLQVEEFTEGEFEIPVELPPSQRSKVTLVPSNVRVRFTADLSTFSKIRSTDFQAYTSVPFPETPTLLQVQLKRSPKGAENVVMEPQMINYLIKE
jgi:hypothetical protein